MASYSNNPQSAYNGMISGQRNMFLSSTVAIAMIGFSNNFKNKSIMLITKTVAACIFLLSIYIGLKASHDFQFYLDSIEDKEKLTHIPINSWYSWSYVSYLYSFILFVVAGFFFLRKISF